MLKPVILITGANGQLGKEFRALQSSYSAFNFVFLGKDELSITDREAIETAFAIHQPSFCINCAAYTAVDKAETDKTAAFDINAKAVGYLALASRKSHARFIHISTDYVFDGESPSPYKETDPTKPVNAYGDSKLNGEVLCFRNDPDAIIIRTAWVYSEFGNNFVKTMLRLMKEREMLNVVNDQVGAPTYAADLANDIMKMIASKTWEPGIYHYSNKGKISWFEFAEAIKELSGSNCVVKPIPTSSYPTPAKRPSFSLLDTTKIESTYNLSIPFWKDSLKKCLQQLNAIHG